MSLPIKMSVPQYSITVPSSKAKIPFRPFLVGEQKSMMLALATGDNATIVNAIESIIEICSSNKIRAAELASFDLEYLFLQLRAKSIGESVNLSTECNKCGREIDFKIDINQATVDTSALPDTKIQLDDEIGVEMRFPNLIETLQLEEAEDMESEIIDTVVSCIKSIWNSEDLVNVSDYPRESIIEFVNTLTVPQLKKLTDFIRRVPSVQMIHTETCKSCEKENKILIKGLENFFG